MHKTEHKTFTWLHLGAGAFHRAHQAWYLNKLHLKDDMRWTLALANIRNSQTQKTLQRLREQDGRYTLELISPAGERRYQAIGAISKIILWEPGIRSLIEEGAHSDTRIISFTVTEGGYFLNDDGHLDLQHPSVLADLSGKNDPITLYGALIRILRQRIECGAGPVTLLSCDNLRNNGDSVLSGLTAFIQASDDASLLAWVRSNVSAPNSMVDRITPKFDEKIFGRLAEHGIHGDRVPLSCESFGQWVVQDHFIAGRPALEEAGVDFKDNVTPYEEKKIRVLNASHSGVAWAGALMNKEFIDESLTPQVLQWIRDYVMQDVRMVLELTDSDLPEYCDTTLSRFSNRWVRDTTQRVSSDSIAKLQQYILPVIRKVYAQGARPHATMILPALWMRFMQRQQEGALLFEYEDRALDEVNFRTIFSADDPLRAFTENKKLWGGLAGHPELYEDMLLALGCVDRGLEEAGAIS
ncbi:D-arabinitol 4-dehydrogenase [Pantoea sp. S62]|uniref:D-arabinitol 4-dehydrogenase n=1 Tax=Pantoea sp. S62 TaxID=2769342 RepID=UPI001D7CA050|nr:D-arabinitol 4-dehydrogenase [Pantoea sp. S62]MBK5017201.1 mannitol dehydrogenase family protein [Pantoea sp. S62]